MIKKRYNTISVRTEIRIEKLEAFEPEKISKTVFSNLWNVLHFTARPRFNKKPQKIMYF